MPDRGRSSFRAAQPFFLDAGFLAGAFFAAAFFAGAFFAAALAILSLLRSECSRPNHSDSKNMRTFQSNVDW